MSGSPRADGRLHARPSPDPDGARPAPGITSVELGPGVEVLLGAPPVDPRGLLVFFHGAGGSAADALRAVGARATAAGVAVLAPSSIASTWDLVGGSGPGRDVAVLDAALAQVFDRLPVPRTALAGFSDGGSYALSLGLANGDLADAVLAFSPGFVAAPGRSGRPRVWISHGSEDQVLPVDRCGRRVAGQLRADGYDVTYEEFRGGHVVIPALVTAALDWWLGGS